MNNYPCDETWKEELSLTSKKGRQLGEVAEPSNRSRRSFLLKAGAAATVAVAARTLSLESTSNAQSSGGFSLRNWPARRRGSRPSVLELSQECGSSRFQSTAGFTSVQWR